MSDGVRKYPRFARNADVIWALESRQLSGRGKMVDLSLGGACLKFDATFTGDRGAVVSLLCPSIPPLPTKARVQWIRKSTSGPAYVLCGVAFESASASEWTKWFNANSSAAPVLAAGGARR